MKIGIVIGLLPVINWATPILLYGARQLFALRQDEDLTDMFTARVNSSNKMPQVRNGDTQFSVEIVRCIEFEKEAESGSRHSVCGRRFSRRCSDVVLESRDAEPGERIREAIGVFWDDPFTATRFVQIDPRDGPRLWTERSAADNSVGPSRSYREIYIAPEFSRSRRRRCKTRTSYYRKRS